MSSVGIGIDDGILLDADERRAFEACIRAKADLRSGAERLCRYLEAGRLLRQVKRNPGVRTSSSGLTRLQTIIDRAGVSRQAAHVWQKASEVDEAIVAEYVAQSEAASEDITVAGLLRWAERPDREGDDDDDSDDDADSNLPTHVCPACRCLVVCDRDRER